MKKKAQQTLTRIYNTHTQMKIKTKLEGKPKIKKDIKGNYYFSSCEGTNSFGYKTI